MNAINIVILSLNDKFSINTSKLLADKLDMFVADVHELIVYNLIDPKEVLEKCGLEYMKKRELGVVKNCSKYYNTVLSINYDLFKEYYDIFENSLVFYLRLPEDKVNKVTNKIDYQNRDEFMKSKCGTTLDLNKCVTNQAVNKIIEKIGELYENC